MQDLLNKIDRLLKEKKFFEVKNIVKDENAADLAVLFDELFGEVFGEKTEFMILFSFPIKKSEIFLMNLLLMILLI